jgi:phosphate acetyltransferase
MTQWLSLNGGGAARLAVAVAYPCDELAISAAVEASKAGLIEPILIGPRERIGLAAYRAQCDISAFELIDATDDRAAAAAAVGSVLAGRAHALMKGSLHTDLLLHAVLEAPKLRTGRQMSHCYAIDVAGRNEAMILTDTVVNIAPTLDQKADIVRNAIDLARVLHIEPRVAILAACETVNAKMPATIDAAALSKMAERGQISGALVDGPLALDDAIDPQVARLKGIASTVAGVANVLVVPNLEAGNILAKEIEFMEHRRVAGIVLGATVPIILTSRAENVATRVASCALAANYSRISAAR